MRPVWSQARGVVTRRGRGWWARCSRCDELGEPEGIGAERKQRRIPLRHHRLAAIQLGQVTEELDQQTALLRPDLTESPGERLIGKICEGHDHHDSSCTLRFSTRPKRARIRAERFYEGAPCPPVPPPAESVRRGRIALRWVNQDEMHAQLGQSPIGVKHNRQPSREGATRTTDAASGTRRRQPSCGDFQPAAPPNQALPTGEAHDVQLGPSARCEAPGFLGDEAGRAPAAVRNTLKSGGL